VAYGLQQINLLRKTNQDNKELTKI